MDIEEMADILENIAFIDHVSSRNYMFNLILRKLLSYNICVI